MATDAIHAEGELFDVPVLQSKLQSDARELAGALAPRAREARQHLLTHGEHHPDLWEEFAGRRWPGLVIPPGLGGADGGLLGMAVVLEAFAAQGIVLWMPVLSSAIAHAIAQVGPRIAQEDWLERVARGEASLALAATEPDSGHNLFRATTEIRREAGHYVVSGLKRVTSGLDVAERVLVFARVPRAEGEEGP